MRALLLAGAVALAQVLAAASASAQEAADPHAGHAMPEQAAPEAPGQAPAEPVLAWPAETEEAPAPPPPTDHLADALWGADRMEQARAQLRLEHGGGTAWQVMAHTAEVDGDGAYAWDVEAWYGNDHHRLVLKSEGEGGDGHGLEAAEVQALYSRPIAPYTDVQAGVRYDFEPGPGRAHLVASVETLLPYWFEVEAAAFLSETGDLTARLEGEYDLRLAQRWVLQPQAEIGVSAQAIPELDVGQGLTHAEGGLRLRYEIKREFAPYVGVSFERKLGDTADLARAAGEDVSDTRWVVGLRAWF